MKELKVLSIGLMSNSDGEIMTPTILKGTQEPNSWTTLQITCQSTPPPQVAS